MQSDFIHFLAENRLVDLPCRILLAISGGVDSVVMADLFDKAGFTFGFAHANFHLRGEESDRDEQFVRKLSEKYGVQLFVAHFNTAEYARKNKVPIQVAARDLRYRWFDELLVKHGFDYVATAHHLDDQVETFLINLTRGTGIAGLHGIPLKQGKIIRPLLFARRKEIESYASTNHLEFVEDSSNKSMKYTRNRIRHKIIPELEKINPAFSQALTETIGFIRDAESVYRGAIEETRNSIFDLKGDAISIPVSVFFNLHPLRAYAYELLSPYGFNLSNINDIIGLKDAIPGKEVQSTSHRLVRDRDSLIIVPKHDTLKINDLEINWGDLKNGITSPVNLKFEITEKIPANLNFPANIALIDLDRLAFPLRLRRWKRGDYFIPFGMSKPKKLSDFFIDQKLSKIDKENLWLLCSGDEIAWIIGRRTDDRFKIGPGSGKILKITFTL